jgi:hypothetical protein
MSSFSYLPIVKGKVNDIKAISQVSPSARAGVKPLIELTAPGPETNIDDTLAAFANRLYDLPPTLDVFVDLYGLSPGTTTAGGEEATIAGFSLLADRGLALTPVYRFGFDDSLWPQMVDIVTRFQRGFCFRIDFDDLEDQAEETWRQILERTAELRLAPSDVDLLIDLRYITENVFPQREVAAIDFLNHQPKRFVPRTITLAGSSALKEVGPIPENGHAAIRRQELRLWARLQAEFQGSTSITYGDYGIVHPDFSQAARVTNANGKIRYTAGDSIHYFRGSRLSKPPGYKQYHALAKRVGESRFYCGRGFSVGDAFIDDCANCRVGTGNLPIWVHTDQNHHFEYTAKRSVYLNKTLAQASSARDAERILASV